MFRQIVGSIPDPPEPTIFSMPTERSELTSLHWHLNLVKGKLALPANFRCILEFYLLLASGFVAYCPSTEDGWMVHVLFVVRCRRYPSELTYENPRFGPHQLFLLFSISLIQVIVIDAYIYIY